MMGKHSISKRLSLPDIKSMDYKSRKHIEELYLITEGIINGHDDRNAKFDYKLYRKYKQLKQINRRLQEKIINQHCSGCKCHEQLNEEETDESISTDERKTSTTKEKNSASSSNQRTGSSSDDEPEEEEMDTNENVSKTTVTNDHAVEEEEGDSFSNLPILLRKIIKNKVKQSGTSCEYLLKVGLYPGICKLLSDTSLDSLSYHSKQKEIRPFFSKHVEHNQKNASRIFTRVVNQIRDIHQSYMLEFYKEQEKEESKANRKKQHQRKSL